MASTARKPGIAPELADSVLRRLLTLEETNNEVSNEDVRNAAAVLGCSTRTIRNMISRGYVRKPRNPWKPSEDVDPDLTRWKGSVAELHKKLENKGTATRSVRTMQRGFANHYSQPLLAGARGGSAAMDAMLPFYPRPIPGLNDEWQIDHTKLPNWVEMPDGSVDKPWMTTVIECRTRTVIAITISPRNPTAEESVQTLATAVAGWTTEEGVFVGGKPKRLLSDRGGDFLTRAMTLGLIEKGIEKTFTERNNPRHNGKIERWHKTLKCEVCPGLAAYDRSDWEQRDPRTALIPPLAPNCMPIEGYAVEVITALRDYNFTRPHTKLQGQTPVDVWTQMIAETQSLVTRCDAGALRASMTQLDDRVLARRLIRWDNRLYQLSPHSIDAPDEDTETVDARRELILHNEGRHVTVRHLPSRIEYLSIHTKSGQYLGDAIWTEYLTPEQAGHALGARREGITTLVTALEAIKTADAAATAAYRARALGSDTPADDAAYGPPVPSPKSKNGGRRKPTSTQQTVKETARRATTRHDVHDLNLSVVQRTGTDDI